MNAIAMLHRCAAHQDVDACYVLEVSGQESTPFAPTADLAPTDQGVEGADRTWATVNEPGHRIAACE